MNMKLPGDAQVHFQTTPNWRTYLEDVDPDDELIDTPDDVIAALGFDPAEFDNDEPEDAQKKTDDPAQFALNDESPDLVAEAVRRALERIQATKDDILSTISSGSITSPAELLTRLAAKVEAGRLSVQEQLQKLLVSADIRGAAEVARVFGSTRFAHLAAPASSTQAPELLPSAAGAFVVPPEPPASFLTKTPGEETPWLRLPVVDDAIAVLRDSPVGAGMDYQKTAEMARQGAFAVTGDLADNTIEDLRGLIEDQLREGWNRDDFRTKARAVLEEGRGYMSDAHLNLVFQQNVNKQVSEAKERILRDPIVVSAFPYRRYISTTDPRVRDEHRALRFAGIDGTNIYNVDDPVWKTFQPPWDWGCRCAWAPVTVKQAADAGVSEAKAWWNRAVAIASESGGEYPERYLGETTPERFEFVEWPSLDGEKFYPPPEFQK